MRNKLMFGTALLLAGFGTAAAQNNAGAQGNARQPTAHQTQEQSGQAPGAAQRNNGGEERRGAESGTRRETTGQAPSSGKDESREKNAAETGGRNPSPPTNTQTKSPGNQSEQGAARDNQQRNQNVGQEERRNSRQETSPRTKQQEPRTGQQDNGPRPGQREGSEGGDRANNQRGDRNTTTGQTGQNEREPRNGSVTLNSEQQTRIRDTVLSGRNVPRVDDVTFAINVGSRVPTDIRIVEVPTALIDIHPEWRSDSYFVVRDEIVIVDGSRNIVATVPVGSSNAQLENRGSRTSVNLSSAEIREVQTELQRQGFEIGEIDGVMGARTREAIIAFQKRSGFQATGEIDRDTFSALSEKRGNVGPDGQRNDRGGQQGNADTGRRQNPSRSPSQAQTSNPRENSKSSSQNASPKDAPSDRESSTTGQGNGGDRTSPPSQSPRRNENQR